MKKTIVQTKKISKGVLFVSIVSIFAASLVFLNLPKHTFAASGGLCYDTNAANTYDCGPGTPNPYSFIPIQGQSVVSPPVSDVSEWAFSSTQCYSLSTSGGVSTWVGGQDCSKPQFTQNPLSTTMPSAQAPDSAATCGSGCNLITEYLNPIINFLSAAVGIVVISMVVVGGIQYSTSGGNPQSAAAAKKRIANALLASFIFLFLYGFLQFIVPGGFFNG